MNIITIGILLILLVLSYTVSKSILAPAVVTNFIWTVLLLIYNTVDHGLYTLSDKFYFIVLLWTGGFTISALFTEKIRIRIPRAMKSLNKEGLGNKLLWVMVIALCLSIYGQYLIGNNLNSDNVFAGIRQHSVSMLNGEEASIILPAYISVAKMLAPFAVIVIGTLFFLREDRRFLVIIGLVLLVVYVLFRSNKLAVVELIFSLFGLYVLKKGITRKKIIYFFSIFVVFMLLAHLMRRKEDNTSVDLVHILSVYLLSPLPAFDNILNNSSIRLIEDFNGEYTFRAFIPYLNLLGFNLVGNSDPFNLHFWTYTPLPVNVYTIFFSFYADFGTMGIVVASIAYGAFFGFLWNGGGWRHNIPMFQMAYAVFFYTLIFQFFADFLFHYFWNTALALSFIFFFFTHFSFGHIIKKNEHSYIRLNNNSQL